MQADKIKKLIFRLIRKLSDRCSDPDDFFDQENIHHFRVLVKTLRALLRLIKLSDGTDHIRLPAALLRLYHCAGSVRDLQLEIRNVQDLPFAVPGYIERLEAEMQQKKANGEKLVTQRIFRKMKRTFSTSRFEALPPDALKNLIDTKMNVVYTLCDRKRISDNQMHDVRKAIKDILFAHDIATEHWKNGVKNAGPLPIEWLKSTAAEMGAYNDARNMLARMKNHIASLPEQQKAELEPHMKLLVGLQRKRKQLILYNIRGLRHT